MTIRSPYVSLCVILAVSAAGCAARSQAADKAQPVSRSVANLPLKSGARDVSTITPNREVTGSLGASDDLFDGSHFDLYTFTGKAGDQITIDLTSDDFDSYLMVAAGELGNV